MDTRGTDARREDSFPQDQIEDDAAPGPAPTDRCWATRVTHHARRRVYTRRLRTIQIAFLLFGTALAVAGPVGEFMMGDPERGPKVAGVVTLCGLLLAFRWWRAAIVVSPGKVTIRGLLRSRTLDVQSVARFVAPAPYGRLWHTGMRICLINGKVRRAGVFAPTPIDGGVVGSEEAAELNLWLRTQQQGADPAPELPTPSKGSTGARIAWGLWVGFVALLALVTVTFGAVGMDSSQYVR